MSIADIQDRPLQEIKNEVKNAGGDVLACGVDVRKPKDVEALIEAAIAKFRQLDGAVNLAGVVPKSHNISFITERELLCMLRRSMRLLASQDQLLKRSDLRASEPIALLRM